MVPVRFKPTVVACVPDAIPAAERAAHFALAKQLFSELAEERDALADGYAFRFSPDALGSIAKLVENERKCCPFMDFAISLSASGELWLRMTGPEGTREVLDAELSLGTCSTSACGCSE
jgi:hypothetical protein